MTLTPLQWIASLPDRLVLALLIWAESRGEPVEGQIAVGCVVRNRLNESTEAAPRWRDICLAPEQFSCFNDLDADGTVMRAWCRAAWRSRNARAGAGPVDRRRRDERQDAGQHEGRDALLRAEVDDSAWQRAVVGEGATSARADRQSDIFPRRVKEGIVRRIFGGVALVLALAGPARRRRTHSIYRRRLCITRRPTSARGRPPLRITGILMDARRRL